MKKILENLFVIISILIITWFVISYIEIISKNIGENPQYSFWNFFEIFFSSNK